MIAVYGTGAFGTAMAITLARTQPVTLWGRDASDLAEMARTRQSGRKLPGQTLPDLLTVEADVAKVSAEVGLICVPTQRLSAFLSQHARHLAGQLVACCKGIDLATGQRPSQLMLEHGTPAVLTGPSFAVDLAQGLPTALSLACSDDTAATTLQERLSSDQLRLYRTTDVVGAELGGALKNVVAIACGIVAGAGLGQSARAATMTRGFAEMQRYALTQGADPRTLQGLSGFGDLVLTCTSDASRNFRFGQALGAGAQTDPNMTVEGRATAEAILPLAREQGVDMPICETVAALVQGETDVATAIQSLMRRPLKEE